MDFLKTNGTIEPTDISEVGITDGLVGWWPLNGNANDITVNGNNGTVYGATVASGLDQLCYSFTYTTDYIQLDPSALSYNKAVTISSWAYSNDITKAQNIISRNPPYFLRITSSTLRCAIYTGTWIFANGIIPLLSNTWYHLVLTYDGAYMKGYVNAQLDINSAKTGDMQTFGDLRIGYTTGGEDAPFDGKIQDVRIYNRALSAEEVKIQYELTKNKVMNIDYTGKLYTAGKIIETY